MNGSRVMRVGVLGFGNVAASTLQSFTANRDLILSRCRVPFDIVRVATRTPQRALGRVPPACGVCSDPWSLVNDPDIDVVVELTGDVPTARALLVRALANGKHVVTANKALLALHGQAIFRAADAVGRYVLFEGAVAVSIPIVKILREAVAANRIGSITGILNGTSNYVLSQMADHALSFQAAVVQAQRLGYAEADPVLDVSGEDAAHKIALLAALAFGTPIDFPAVRFQGIESIAPVDLLLARRLHAQIKLVACARARCGHVQMQVQPMMVSHGALLAQVRGAMNGIVIEGDLMGSLFVHGAGAGGVQTASAVLADLIEIANRAGTSALAGGASSFGQGHRTAVTPPPDPLDDGSDAPCYLRLELPHPVQGLAQAKSILAGVSGTEAVEYQCEAGQLHWAVILPALSGTHRRECQAALASVADRGCRSTRYPILGDLHP